MPKTVAAPSTAVRLASQSALSLVGYLFTFALGFPFQIYIAQNIGASGVGLISLVDSGVQMLAGILGFGIAPAMLKWVPYYRVRRQYGSLSGIVAKGGVILILAGMAGYFLMLGVGMLFKGWWPAWDGAHDIVLVMGLSIPLTMLLLFLMETLRGFGDMRPIVVGNSFIQLTVKIICAMALFSLGWGTFGLACAMVAGLAMAVAWLAWALWRRMAPVWSQAHHEAGAAIPSQWGRYAQIMYAGSLVGIVVAPVDRFLLGNWSGGDAVGIYSVVMMLFSATGVVQLMLLTVASPMFAEIDGEGFDRARAEHLYQVCTDWVMRATLPAILFLACFAFPVLHLFGASFADQGFVPLLILIFAQAVGLMAGPGGRLLKMAGHEAVLLKSLAFQAPLAVLGFAIFIPMWGLVGAACGVALNLAMGNAIALWILTARAKISWYAPRYLRWVMPSLATLAVCLGIHLLFGENMNAFALLGTLGVAYFVFHTAYLVGGLQAEDHEVLQAVRASFGGRVDRLVRLIDFTGGPSYQGPYVRRSSAFLAPRLTRPVVIIHSDDWGLAGIPSADGIDRLKLYGFGTNPWDRYGLESREDLEALGNVLSKHRDQLGNPACFTANFILANADLRRMKAESFAAFRAVPISDNFPVPWADSLLTTYRALIEQRVFYPGMHGYTHFNVEGFLDACKDTGVAGRMARALVDEDLASSGSLTPEYHFALMRTQNGQEVFLDRAQQAAWVEESIRIFQSTFGAMPVTSCAPGYRCNNDTVSLWREAGVKIVQTSGGNTLKVWGGLLNISRNTNFEPLLHGPNCIETALAEAERAYKKGLPIVVCSHSINYITRHNNFGVTGRALLDQFLTRLLERFPDIVFSHDAHFADLWEHQSADWFVRPNAATMWHRL